MTMLGVIAEELNGIGVPYEFMEWTDPVQYPYAVGEYTDTSPTNEDGRKDGTLLLTITTRGTWLELEQLRVRIEKHFHPVAGLQRATDDGVVAIYYGNSLAVPTGEAELKRIQINLECKEWRSN